MTNSSIGLALGLVSTVVLLVGSALCIYGLNSRRYLAKIRQLAVLGMILTILIVFGIAATRYAVIALAVIPSPIIFIAGIFRPTLIKHMYAQIYLTVCLSVGIAISLANVVWLVGARN